VLSGYLITDLLAARRARRGRLGLRGFWTRRARRLLPAPAAAVQVTTSVPPARQSRAAAGPTAGPGPAPGGTGGQSPTPGSSAGPSGPAAG
jgi:peptidoglycan/LPS O-acetylase OafA/YrhL